MPEGTSHLFAPSLQILTVVVEGGMAAHIYCLEQLLQEREAGPRGCCRRR